jgi:phosphohistidine phosphatase
MELILWRHAEAADTAPDMARVLTHKGRRQAQAMADWMTSQLAGPVRVIASRAVRTQQTARALRLPVEVLAQIDPDASADALLAATGWPGSHGVVILVGHNRAISELAARLAGKDTAALSLGLGAAFWYAGGDDGAPGLTLKTAMTPALLLHG